MVVYLKLAAFHPERLARIEMLDFGCRRLKARTAPIAQPETGVTSHSGQPELPEKVIPSTTGLAPKFGPGEAQ